MVRLRYDLKVAASQNMAPPEEFDIATPHNISSHSDEPECLPALPAAESHAGTPHFGENSEEKDPEKIRDKIQDLDFGSLKKITDGIEYCAQVSLAKHRFHRQSTTASLSKHKGPTYPCFCVDEDCEHERCKMARRARAITTQSTSSPQPVDADVTSKIAGEILDVTSRGFAPEFSKSGRKDPSVTRQDKLDAGTISTDNGNSTNGIRGRRREQACNPFRGHQSTTACEVGGNSSGDTRCKPKRSRKSIPPPPWNDDVQVGKSPSRFRDFRRSKEAEAVQRVRQERYKVRTQRMWKTRLRKMHASGFDSSSFLDVSGIDVSWEPGDYPLDHSNAEEMLVEEEFSLTHCSEASSPAPSVEVSVPEKMPIVFGKPVTGVPFLSLFDFTASISETLRREHVGAVVENTVHMLQPSLEHLQEWGPSAMGYFCLLFAVLVQVFMPFLGMYW